MTAMTAAGAGRFVLRLLAYLESQCLPIGHDKSVFFFAVFHTYLPAFEHTAIQ